MKIKNKIGKFISGVVFSIVFLFSASAYVQAATPTVTFNPNSSTIAPGTSITVNGSGFPTGSGLVISINNVNKAALFPDPSGNISTIISSSDSNIKSTGTNTISFTATDATNNSLQVNGDPLIFSVSGSTGSQVTAPTTDCTKATGSPNCVYNPLPTGDLTSFILSLMKWLLGTIGIIAVLFIMIGGFKMITAQGNEEAIGAAKKTITWAIIGLVVAVLSFSMIAIVENLLQANIKSTITQSK